MCRRAAHLLCITFLLIGAQSLLAAKNDVSSDYVLQPSDLIRVLVFQEPDLEREVRITQEHSITLPLIGRVSVKGLTVRQAEESIRSLYDKDYLVNPQINLTVLEYVETTVQVVGSVNNPGVVRFLPEQKLTLMEAIARAGGHSRLADLRKVRLTRTTSEGQSENFTVKVDELVNGTSSGEQWVLIKGVVIYVPERIL